MQARAFQHLRVLERSIDPSAELWFPTGQVGEAAFVSIPVARGAEDEEPEEPRIDLMLVPAEDLEQAELF